MNADHLKHFVPDGDCKRCRVRKTCLASCAAAKRYSDRLAQVQERNRKEVQLQIWLKRNEQSELMR